MNSQIAALFTLTGRVALVTGGSSGLGKSIGWALAAAGASVILVARRADQLAAATAEFARDGLDASAFACDLTDRQAIAAMAAQTGRSFREPDILVNASAINPRTPFASTTDDDWDLTLATNLTAPFLLTRAYAPRMAERGWGRIINITSLQSVRAFANGAPYGASKAGLMQLTRSTAEY